MTLVVRSVSLVCNFCGDVRLNIWLFSPCLIPGCPGLMVCPVQLARNSRPALETSLPENRGTSVVDLLGQWVRRYEAGPPEQPAERLLHASKKALARQNLREQADAVLNSMRAKIEQLEVELAFCKPWRDEW